MKAQKSLNPLTAMFRAVGMIALSVSLLQRLPSMNAQGTSPTTSTPTSRLEKATLGGGCFWCLEAVYEILDGVTSVTSGYAGGPTPNPTYRQVCEGTTGHAEVIQIEFDPTRVTFAQLLDHFWKVHDPTTLNRQGADIGTQYRSVILAHNDTQLKMAQESKAKAAAKFQDPIVTEIAPLSTFYPAEAYHQDYYRKNPNAAYCQVVIKPKLKKLGK